MMLLKNEKQHLKEFIWQKWHLKWKSLSMPLLFIYVHISLFLSIFQFLLLLLFFFFIFIFLFLCLYLSLFLNLYAHFRLIAPSCPCKNPLCPFSYSSRLAVGRWLGELFSPFSELLLSHGREKEAEREREKHWRQAVVPWIPTQEGYTVRATYKYSYQMEIKNISGFFLLAIAGSVKNRRRVPVHKPAFLHVII